MITQMLVSSRYSPIQWPFARKAPQFVVAKGFKIYGVIADHKICNSARHDHVTCNGYFFNTCSELHIAMESQNGDSDGRNRKIDVCLERGFAGGDDGILD